LIKGFYDYVYGTMTYSKEGEGWGQGDAVWACQSKYGNCTDFHSLYIGMVRSQGIPARFKIGFPISPEKESGRHDGYHCWAEVYQEDKGWVPLDASEAKKAGMRDEYFGKLPSDRVEFSLGRDLVMSEKQRGEPINYFIYPYAESENAIINRLPVKLTYQRINNKKFYSGRHVGLVLD
jgi:transglutaminase-like putative cysteine protease